MLKSNRQTHEEENRPMIFDKSVMKNRSTADNSTMYPYSYI
jgi:hypothetical protein